MALRFEKPNDIPPYIPESDISSKLRSNGNFEPSGESVESIFKGIKFKSSLSLLFFFELIIPLQIINLLIIYVF